MPNPRILDERTLTLGNVKNKYELIVVAAKRSRQLRDGSPPLVHSPSDKEPVIALQEIIDGKIAAMNVTRIREGNHDKKE
jgi:DNA-directed RNA polymerase subunit omega